MATRVITALSQQLHCPTQHCRSMSVLWMFCLLCMMLDLDDRYNQSQPQRSEEEKLPRVCVCVCVCVTVCPCVSGVGRNVECVQQQDPGNGSGSPQVRCLWTV